MAAGFAMLEAGLEAVSDATSAAMYGRRKQRNFGKALYQIRDERYGGEAQTRVAALDQQLPLRHALTTRMTDSRCRSVLGARGHAA